MADARRLAELGMAAELAKEVKKQIEAGGGSFTPGVAVPDAAAAPTQAEFNALLASLRGAGLIAS